MRTLLSSRPVLPICALGDPSATHGDCGPWRGADCRKTILDAESTDGAGEGHANGCAPGGTFLTEPDDHGADAQHEAGECQPTAPRTHHGTKSCANLLDLPNLASITEATRASEDPTALQEEQERWT